MASCVFDCREKKSLEKKQSSEIQAVLQSIDDVQKELNDLSEENNRLNNYYENLYAKMNQVVRK